MILYFSGTGNSKAVAYGLSRMIGDDAVRSILPSGGIPGSNPSGRFIWVFPIYCWNVPPVVRDFIKNCELPDNGAGEHYMVATAGDDIGLAALEWRKLIRGKGWTDYGAFSVQMPNNYIGLPGFDVDSEELEKQKLHSMPQRVKAVGEKIIAGFRGEDTVRGDMAWIKTRLIYPLFKRVCMSPRGFKVNHNACIHCSKCVVNCPSENIRLNDSEFPEWGDSCTFCLRCYHICPVNAIQHGMFSKGKGQYILDSNHKDSL